MLTILGPAKTINTDPHQVTAVYTMPDYLDHSDKLVGALRKLTPAALMKLMKTSQKLTNLTIERYAKWKRNYSKGEGHHALLAFSGEVFNGLQARSLKEADLLFAQDHVRILSGLYGILRPLDLILPYRLEIGTRLQTDRHSDLYSFWEGIIPPEIRKLTEDQGKVLINLASNEYFRSIDPSGFPFRIITPVFKESDGNGFRNVTIYAKKARGMMLRFIIENRIDNPEDIRAFNQEGYYFNPEQSAGDDWWFTR